MEDIFSNSNPKPEEPKKSGPVPVYHPGDNERIKTYEIDLSKYMTPEPELSIESETVDYDDYYNSGAYNNVEPAEPAVPETPVEVPVAEEPVSTLPIIEIPKYEPIQYGSYFNGPEEDVSYEEEPVEYDESYSEEPLEYENYEEDEFLPALEDDEDYEKSGIFNNRKFMSMLIAFLAIILIALLSVFIVQFGGLWHSKGNTNPENTVSVSEEFDADSFERATGFDDTSDDGFVEDGSITSTSTTTTTTTSSTSSSSTSSTSSSTTKKGSSSSSSSSSSSTRTSSTRSSTSRTATTESTSATSVITVTGVEEVDD